MDENLFSDIVVEFSNVEGLTLFPQEQGEVRVIVTNQADNQVRESLDINLYASTDSVLDLPVNESNQTGTDELLGTISRPIVNLAPGESKSFVFNFANPEFRTPSVVAPGSYYLLAEVDPSNTIAESNEDNNLTSMHISADNSDVVLDWNATALNAIQATATRNPELSRTLAIVHAAIYDAVNVIDQSHNPYYVNIDPSEVAGASPEAAAAAAAHRALVNLIRPQAATFDLQLNRSLAEIPDDAAEDAGIALGEYVADQILALRSTDGADNPVDPNYTPGTKPGEWQPTPSDFTPAAYTRWGQVTPFVIPTALNFRPDSPPELSSDEYAADLNEIKAIGAINSSTRTADQTEIARFWSSLDRADTLATVGQWNKIAENMALQQGNTLAENARLFALLNIVQADAIITEVDTKYTYNQWRPITAIREADTDSNADTVADPDWTPLLPTPPAPSYIGSLGVFAGAAAEVLTDFFNEDLDITFTSPELPGVSRSYGSFLEAAQENAISALYSGQDYRSSIDQGLATGIDVANYVIQNSLVPII
jgi:hypothetical protein